MNWLQEHRKGLVNVEQLNELNLLKDAPEELIGVEELLNIRVPNRFVATDLIRHPEIALQVVPSKQEFVFADKELDDPIGDEEFSPVEGITHRYPDRVLLKPTYHCGMYCRFCFRRNKVSKPHLDLSTDAQKTALNYIAQHSEIREVILTGGDPLILTESRLAPILEGLNGIEHIKSIRFHTRCLTAFPERITPEFLAQVSKMRAQMWFVSHINSHKEWSESAFEKLKLLQQSGVALAAQTVLLKNVNNSLQALKSLFLMLYENGVVPYYLHNTDLAKGTNHFRVSLFESIQLVSELRGNLPGLAIPNLVVDIPGGAGKVLAESSFAKFVSMTSDFENWEFFSPLQKKWMSVSFPVSRVLD
jgi:lysine 2,3-aminomutase